MVTWFITTFILDFSTPQGYADCIVKDIATSSQSFEDRTNAVMQRVRGALGELITRVTRSPRARAHDLVETLTIDSRLAWKFVKIVEEKNALGAVRYIPGPRGIKLFLKAAAKRPGIASAVESARDAFGVFDELVRHEAGDRRSFEMMVTGHIGSAGAAAEIEHRKGAFQHGSYIWGTQARVQIHTFIIQPSGDGEHLDAAILRGFVDLRRIRPHIPWRISRFYTINDLGQVQTQFAREPLDPVDGPVEDAVPLLRDFCTTPVPDVRRIRGSAGVVEDVLAESDVGNSQAVTCLTGEIIRRVEPCYASDEHRFLGMRMPMRTPCEVAVMDIFLKRDFFGRPKSSVRLFSDLFKESMGVLYSEPDELPTHEDIAFLGAGVLNVQIREMPKYTEIVEHAFDRLGWRSDTFDCYRLQMQYPPIPTALSVDNPLPPRP